MAAEQAEAELKTVGGSRVTMSRLCAMNDCDDAAFLSVGTVLKWMDINACLAAERHCLCNCVTISMDDLNIEHDIPCGDIVTVVGQVNNAFNTSMEVGVSVHSEAKTGEIQMVCSAFFMFVALGEDGRKKKVPRILAESVEEQHSFALAAERRAIRLVIINYLIIVLSTVCSLASRV